MDVSTFFTRLLQSAPKEPEKVRAPDSEYRLFDETWQAIQETLLHPDERQILRGIATTDVPAQLQLLTDTLVNEANRAEDDSTGPCLEYLLKHDLLAQLEKLSDADRPHGIRREVLTTVNNLIILLPDNFLVHNAVHRPLRRLLRSSIISDEGTEKVYGASSRVYGAAATVHRRTTSITGPIGQDYEADLVDLMCTLCSKMRAYPPLLLIFFHDKGWIHPHPSAGAPTPNLETLRARTLSPTPSAITSHSHPSVSTSSKPTPRFEFLLFSYLLRFVHREGRIGDFARAGLLFLFDIAFLSPEEEGGDNLQSRPQGDGTEPLRDAREALAEYMLDGDFADVMAATLGAVYSLLPTKLRVASALAIPPAKDGEGDNDAAMPGAEDGQAIALSTDEPVRTQLDHFLKLVGFLQDITRRCSSSISASTGATRLAQLGGAVSEAVIEAMRTSFLDNVLYPSILECSPVDGSSVGVMTYLDVVLSNLDDGPLLTALLDYLFADTDRFTIKDLVLENMESGSSAASAAALRLAGTLLKEHCATATTGLLHVQLDPSHNRARRSDESNLYSALLRRIDPRQGPMRNSTGYSAYMADATNALQQDRCFTDADRADPLASASDDSNPRSSTTTGAHTLDPDDPLSRAVFVSFGDFLTKPPEENIALTGLISALALCPRRSLAGWLVDDSPADTINTQYPSAEVEKDADESDDEFAARCRPDHSPGDPFLEAPAAVQPVVYQILRDITNQISRVRAQTRDFERLLQDRRRQLISSTTDDGDAADEEGSVGQANGSSTPGTPQRGATAVSPAPKRAMISPFGSLRNFFSPQKKTPGGVPRPASPDPRSVSSSAAAGNPSTPPRLGTPAGNGEAGGTGVIRLDGSASKITGPWGAETPAFLTPDRRTSSALAARDRPDTPMSDTSLQRTGPRPQPKPRHDGPATVKLDQVLANCIVLEEFIKEIVAIINARRALGIDRVGYS